MKRSELLFGLLKLPLDIIALLCALSLAYYLRWFNIDLVPHVQFITAPAQLPDFSYYFTHFALYAIGAYIALLALSGLYALRVTMSVWREMGRIIVLSFLWFALIIAWFFLVKKELFFSRILLLHALTFVTIFVILGRSFVLLLQRFCLRRGIGARYVVSFGAHELASSMLRTLARDPRYRYVGHVTSMHGLVHFVHQHSLDLVFHTDFDAHSSDTLALIDYCRSYHIGYALLPSVFTDVPHQLCVDYVDLIPILRFQPTPLDGWGRVIKRVVDIVFSSIFLLFFSPLFLIVGVLIFLFDGRPVFYRSRRIGQYGTSSIFLLKFRTMYPDADVHKKDLLPLSHRRDGPLFKIKDDPRITPLGSVLRRWSIDELPQLLNVLLGHLSLVGPRPHLREEVERYEDPQRRVFAVKPGITGLAQISGRSNLSFDAEVRLDLRYIEDWSLLLDFWILWRTVWVVLHGKGAD